MKMTFRWFGDDDRVPLEYIRQIPGVSGVVTALHDIPAGEVWELDRLEQRKDAINAAGLAFSVVESIPVHEDIKLGRPTRERFVDTYAESIRNVGEIGVSVICYNFMPVFDWTRTDLEMPLPDGSTALAFDDDALSGIDLSAGTGNLPG
nr:mannonate dehydratase [Gemmatimonadota bacterium]